MIITRVYLFLIGVVMRPGLPIHAQGERRFAWSGRKWRGNRLVSHTFPQGSRFLNTNRPCLSDDYFQAVYGVSILTHLSLEDQTDWIAELLRVTRKNGIVILSYHGSNSLLRFNLSSEDFEELQHGYLNLGKTMLSGKTLKSERSISILSSYHHLPTDRRRLVG